MRSAISRVTTSVLPPGLKGTTITTGRDGKAVAPAGCGKAGRGRRRGAETAPAGERREQGPARGVVEHAFLPCGFRPKVPRASSTRHPGARSGVARNARMGWGGAMRTTPGRRAAAALLGAACVLPAAPPRAAATPERVVVSSKIDTEGALLGNMILLALEALGVPVAGPAPARADAHRSGRAARGRGGHLSGIHGQRRLLLRHGGRPRLARRAASAHATAARLDARANNLVWLPRAPANNTWAIAVRGDVARREGLRTMEDFAAAAPRGALKLAASAEFVESPAALPAFERAYGFTMPRRRVVVLPGGETAATLRAAAQNVSGVNASMVYGTDGALAVLDLVVMADTRGAQAVYEPAPVARAAVLERHPAIAPALSRIFSALSLERLRALNAEVAVEGQPPRRVARRHLLREGVLS